MVFNGGLVHSEIKPTTGWILEHQTKHIAVCSMTPEIDHVLPVNDSYTILNGRVANDIKADSSVVLYTVNAYLSLHVTDVDPFTGKEHCQTLLLSASLLELKVHESFRHI